MFYETVVHELLPVRGPVDAASLVKSGSLAHYKVPTWTHEGLTICVVSDVHADDRPFGESAILIKKDDGYVQVESYTFAWMNETAVIQALIDMQNPANHSGDRKCTLIVDITTGTETAWFTCGCCGESFKGNVQKQLEYDQDAGFGICKSCERYH